MFVTMFLPSSFSYNNVFSDSSSGFKHGHVLILYQPDNVTLLRNICLFVAMRLLTTAVFLVPVHFAFD